MSFEENPLPEVTPSCWQLGLLLSLSLHLPVQRVCVCALMCRYFEGTREYNQERCEPTNQPNRSRNPFVFVCAKCESNLTAPSSPNSNQPYLTSFLCVLPPPSISCFLCPRFFLLSRRASQPSQALNQPEGRNLKAKRAKKEPSERSQQKQQQQQQGLVGDLFVSRKGQADAFIRLKRSDNV